MFGTKCRYKYVFAFQKIIQKLQIIFLLFPYPSYTDGTPDCFLQNGEQISFFWEFFCLDLREVFAVFRT